MCFSPRKGRKKKAAHRHKRRLMPSTFYLDLSLLRRPPTKGLHVFVFPSLCRLTATSTKLDAVKSFPPSLSFSSFLTVLVHFHLLLAKQTPPFFLVLWHMACCNPFWRQSQETFSFFFQVNHNASVRNKFTFPRRSLAGTGTHAPGKIGAIFRNPKVINFLPHVK